MSPLRLLGCPMRWRCGASTAGRSRSRIRVGVCLVSKHRESFVYVRTTFPETRHCKSRGYETTVLVDRPHVREWMAIRGSGSPSVPSLGETLRGHLAHLARPRRLELQLSPEFLSVERQPAAAHLAPNFRCGGVH